MFLCKSKSLSLMIFLYMSSVFSMHHVNRYFPLLERPRVYDVEKFSNFSAYAFITNATTAYDKMREKMRIPALFGEYDLKDVIDSYKNVTEQIDGNVFTNPFISVGGAEGQKFINHNFRYDVSAKIRSVGLNLQYDQKIFDNFSLGFSIPIMQVTSSREFSFKMNRAGTAPDTSMSIVLQDGDKALIHKVRRFTHDAIGVTGKDLVESGIGDLDCYAKLHSKWDYLLLMRSIALDYKFGILIPCGERIDWSNYTSVPFGTNNHLSGYFELDSEFELKQDLTAGVMLGVIFQEMKSQRMRIPVGNEAAAYSSLIDHVAYRPGITFKSSEYFTLQNLMDGLNFQLRHTFLIHARDRLRDARLPASQQNLVGNINNHEKNTEWRSHYLTLQFDYNSKEAMKKWSFDPKVFISADLPFDWIGGKYSLRTHQFSMGAELHF